MSTTPIVQFGTSRFLQAHADLFVSDALARGEAVGPITVVQTSGDPARAGRLAALAAPGGFPVQIRGLQDGTRIEDDVQVTSVTRALSTARDLAEIERVVAQEAEIILSNTADAGFRPSAADGGARFDQAMSFPAKLAHLLRGRFDAGGRPIQVMPTELIRDNGQVLRGLVIEAARDMPPAYRDWLREGVFWADSLVDRIVSAPIEPAGAIAEPYALWAIADHPRLRLPCIHPAVEAVADLGAVARLKLFILNLGHTVLAGRWLAADRAGPAHVREAAADPGLEAVWMDEILPTFRRAGAGDAAEAYIAQTRERFANPFLEHRLEDIAGNHGEKLDRRIGAFLSWAQEVGDTADKPRLAAIMAQGAPR